MIRNTIVLAIPFALLVAACTPDDGRDAGQTPGSAAPDMTPGTTPPPVPIVPDDTAEGTAEPFDATARTDIGAVQADTARRP
jgi:hypothetical protein